jgi:diguanylate cyclase
MSHNGASFSPADGLGVVLDEHLRWIGQWHRAVFYREGEGVDEETPPASFARWVSDASDDDLAHQPAVEKLINLHELMHRQARFLRLKATTGDFPTEAEYEGVINRFDEFCVQLRRVERAFGAAQSALDTLTGLRHRRGMGEALEREENRFRRTGQPYCVAIGDIDKFKSVNDTYGHDVGDKVISAFAAVISRSIRNFDEAFRMGGEEFLICLKETDLEDGFQVIDRLRQSMQNNLVPLPDGKSFSVTASFGIAQSHAGFSPEELIKQADQALYQSKNNGRNQVTRFLPPGYAPPPQPQPQQPVRRPAAATTAAAPVRKRPQ